MAERTLVRLEDVAAGANLAAAFHRAAQGKRDRDEVRRFEARLDAELAALGRDILAGSVEVGRGQTFRIFDPKPRLIHAPAFRERVLHHALMAWVGPALERSLVADTFACRVGKGTLAAVVRAQQHCRGHSHYLKLDVQAYFASLDHELLRALLARRVRGSGVLALLDRILAAHGGSRGVPIGALTSQHFANVYLGELDRRVLEHHRAGLVRYMDDVVVFGSDPAALGATGRDLVEFAAERLRLTLEPAGSVASVAHGVPLCGFRVFAHRLQVSRRRCQRYRRARRYWETLHGMGLVSPRQLQAGYAAALAIVSVGGSADWRRVELSRRPAPDV